MNNPKEPSLEKHFQTVLLTVITAGVIAMFTFLWDMNAKIALMEERDKNKSENISNLQETMNKVQLEMVDIKERMARLESNK